MMPLSRKPIASPNKSQPLHNRLGDSRFVGTPRKMLSRPNLHQELSQLLRMSPATTGCEIVAANLYPQTCDDTLNRAWAPALKTFACTAVRKPQRRHTRFRPKPSPRERTSYLERGNMRLKPRVAGS